MTSELFKKIEDAMKDAMRAHDDIKRDCLRSVISDIKNQTVNAGKEITDAICLKTLQKSVKMHNDSIAQFSAARREDLAGKEIAELDVLVSFLPKMLSEAEVEAIAKDALHALEVQLGRPLMKKDMGMAMKAISANPYAQSIDMKIASKVVMSILS